MSGAKISSTHWLAAWFIGALFLFAACQNQEKSAEAPGYRVLVVEQGSGELSLFDPQDGDMLGTVKIGYNPHEIAVTRDGRTAYVSNFGIEDYDHTLGVPGTTIAVVDLATMTLRDSLFTNRDQLEKAAAGEELVHKAPHGVRLRPPAEQELFVNVEVGDAMLVYDLPSGQIKRSFPLPAGAHNFIFSETGDRIWLFAGKNGVYRIEPEDGRISGQFQTLSAARGIIFTNDRQQLIVSCENEIYLLGVSDMSLDRHFRDLDVKQIIYSCPTPDDRYILAPCPYDGVVLVIEMESGQVIHRLPTGRAPIYAQIAPDGRHAYVSNALDDHLSVIDLETFEVRSFGKAMKPNGFAFLTGEER